MSAPSTFGRIVSFFLLLVFGGLAQFWAAAFILSLDAHPLDLRPLLVDGGIYFFGTTLVCSSLHELATKEALRAGTLPFNITIGTCFFVGGLALLGYAYLRIDLLHGKGMEISHVPYAALLLTQVVCVALSITYGTYTALKTGILTRRRKAPKPQHA